jgi:hypothetical protein
LVEAVPVLIAWSNPSESADAIAEANLQDVTVTGCSEGYDQRTAPGLIAGWLAACRIGLGVDGAVTGLRRREPK